MKWKYEKEPPMPKVCDPLKIGKWYEFEEMPMSKNPSVKTHHKQAWVGRVVAMYDRFYLVENKKGVKTAISLNELSSNWKAVAV